VKWFLRNCLKRARTSIFFVFWLLIAQTCAALWWVAGLSRDDSCGLAWIIRVDIVYVSSPRAKIQCLCFTRITLHVNSFYLNLLYIGPPLRCQKSKCNPNPFSLCNPPISPSPIQYQCIAFTSVKVTCMFVFMFLAFLLSLFVRLSTDPLRFLCLFAS
jgi:hypothetical protein